MKKRVTPEEDIDRLEERIWRRGRGKIETQDDFIQVYSGYLKDSQSKDNSQLRKKVFERMKQKHPQVSNKSGMSKERKDIFLTAGQRASKKEYDTIGFQKGRQVYVRRTKYKKKDGREITIYRDSKGRFATLKPRK